VREGIFMLGLFPIIGLPAASVVVVAMRIAHTLIELVLSAIGWRCLKSVEGETPVAA
jgi:hypothetical protein